MSGIVIDYEFFGTLIELAFVQEYDFIETVSHQLTNSKVKLTLIHVIRKWCVNSLP